MTDSETAASGDDKDRWREAVLITIAATLIRLFIGILLSPYPDETYYWDWSRHMATGYFDHPPAIAYMIGAGEKLAAVFGGQASTLTIRFFPVLAGGAAALFAAMVARRLGGGQSARRAAMLFAVMPIAASGLILATPDAPLLAAGAATLYFLVRALQSPRGSSQSLMWWIAAGVFLGFAFTSKFTSILYPVTLLVAMMIHPKLRERFLEPGPYVACIVATIVFIPVLQWNSAHDWISFRFQMGHGLGPPRGSFLKRELDLFGGQLALVSPILFVITAMVVWKTLKKAQNELYFMLAVMAMGCFGFFVLSATRRSVEANWPALSYVPAIILVSLWMPKADHWLRRGMGLAGLMSVMIYTQGIATILPIPARKDPVARAAGWNVFANRVSDIRDELSAGGAETYIGSDRYQDVSELAFQLSDRPTTFCTCITGRKNQYELWPGFAATAKTGDNLVLALDDTSQSPVTTTKLAAHFTTVTRGEILPLLRGRDTVSVHRVWRLTGYRGGWPKRD